MFTNHLQVAWSYSTQTLMNVNLYWSTYTTHVSSLSCAIACKHIEHECRFSWYVFLVFDFIRLTNEMDVDMRVRGSGVLSWCKLGVQMNKWKIIYLNCGERCEFVIERRSYTHNLSSFEIKSLKKIQAWTGFEPMNSAIPAQCSTNWAIKLSGSWSLCEFVIYP